MAAELVEKMATENRRNVTKRCGLNHALEEIERRTADEALPCNIEMEREAIFAMLTGEPRYVSVLFAVLTPEDFRMPVYAAIFASLREAWEQGVPFNSPATLVQWVRDGGLARGMAKQLGEVSSHYKNNRQAVEDALLVMRSEGLAINAEYYAITLRRLRLERDIWLLMVDAVRDARRLKPVEWLTTYRDKIAAMIPPEM